MLTPWTRRRREAADRIGQAVQQQLARRAIRQTLTALARQRDPGTGPSVLARRTGR